MAVVVTPVGVRCNLQCGYCYEDPQREAGNAGGDYDIASIKEAVAREGSPFVLFGGEPLLLPKPVLEDLWSWGLNQYGGNTLQTNGTLIDEDHLALFKRYKVRVGISVDGPDCLNDARWQGTLAKTRQATRRTQDNIERLCAEGSPPSLIVILHRLNATSETLPVLLDWFVDLAAIGVRRVGLHLLESESEAVRLRFGLSDDENIAALLRLREFQKQWTKIDFSLLHDIDSLILGDDANAKCIWRACDPYTTAAVRGVGGHGEATKCGRVIKDGVDYLRASQEGFERYLALYQTPQEVGGCQGCRFFLMCRGQCPGTAIDGDWRNRSEQCAIWKSIFEHVETDLLRLGQQPLSTNPERVFLEHEMLRNWEAGRNVTVSSILHYKQAKTSAVSVQSLPEAANGDSSFSSPPPAFHLTAFTRVAWVSTAAESQWRTRFARVRNAILHVEWMSVTHGLRPCALLQLRGEDTESCSRLWKEQGLAWRTLSESTPRTGAWWLDASIMRSEPSRAVVVGSGQILDDFERAWNLQDHRTMGQLLGYPLCCQSFFVEVCKTQHRFDTLWAMTDQEPTTGGNPLIRSVGPHHPESNILLQSLGIRAVPHAPCSFDCPGTAQLARDIHGVDLALGYEEEYEWLLNILSWPAEWSAIHGIAEVKTPILKLCTPTDATPGKHVIRWLGSTMPKEAAKGLGFPYLLPRQSAATPDLVWPISRL